MFQTDIGTCYHCKLTKKTYDHSPPPLTASARSCLILINPCMEDQISRCLLSPTCDPSCPLLSIPFAHVWLTTHLPCLSATQTQNTSSLFLKTASPYIYSPHNISLSSLSNQIWTPRTLNSVQETQSTNPTPSWAKTTARMWDSGVKKEWLWPNAVLDH